MVVGMPFPRARGVALAATAAAALACAISFSGCGASPEPTATPTPAATDAAAPIFASDEEALAAAVAAYEAYAEASDAIAADGGAEPERIDPFVTDQFAVSARQEFKALEEVKGHFEGRISYDSVSLAERTQEDGAAQVSVYLCRDVSGVRALTSDGKDITPSDRAERVPTQAAFISSESDPSVLLVDEISQWPGDDFC